MALSLFVHTDQVELRKVLQHLVENYPVIDVNVSNPPLDQVISKIYRDNGAQSVEVS